MDTIELERGTVEQTGQDEERDDDEIVCHLYLGVPPFNAFKTICGLPIGQDKHCGKHQNASWKKGMLSCPICGAPICMECLLSVS